MKKFLSKRIIIGVAMLMFIFILAPLMVDAEASSAATIGAIQSNINNTPAPSLQPQGGQGGFAEGFNAGSNFSLIIFLVTKLAAVFLSITSYLVEFARNFGDGIINEPIIAMGWGIVLGFANLGFVLAIIVMAFATIFQQQSYAMKNTLWKLIVAALLVNFSLVIAGGFISVSNLLTNTLMKATTYNNLSDALGNAVQPQNFGGEGGGLGYSIGQAIGYVTSLVNPGAWVNFIIKLIFVGIFTILATFAFLTLFIMLLYRAIALAFLLILSPLAWLSWIFPSTSKHWSKWWSEFLRWNFFAPAIMFFIYLTVYASKNVTVKKYGDTTSWTQALGMDVMDTGIRLFIITGLLYGGIYLANKLGVEGGELGVKWAKDTGKKAQDYAGRKAKQYATAPLRAKIFGPKDEQGKRTKSTGEWLTEKSKNMGWFGRQTIGRLAQGTTRLETVGGENILKQYEAKAGKMPVAELKAALLTATGPYQIAILKELQKKKSLGDVNAFKFINKDSQALFNRYRQGIDWGDVEKGAKMNVKMADILKIAHQRGLTLEESDNLQNETNAFVKYFKGADIEKSAVKDLYSGKAKLGLSKETVDAMGGIFANAFAATNYQQVPKIIPTMNASERDNFTIRYEAALENNAINSDTRKKAKEAWRNTMNNFASTGGLAPTAEPAAAPPPPKP